jgi:hypothetical protein
MTPEIQVADQSALELTRFSLPQCCDLHPEKGMRKPRFEKGATCLLKTKKQGAQTIALPAFTLPEENDCSCY